MSHGLISTAESHFSARARTSARTASSTSGHLVIEDGWVFREHHGKYVECLCRTDEMPYLDAETQTKDTPKVQPGRN